MANLEQLEKSVQLLQAGLSMADRVAGWVGRLRTPERQAHYARWRALRLELRAARAQARGRTQQAAILLAKSKVWVRNAEMHEAFLPH